MIRLHFILKIVRMLGKILIINFLIKHLQLYFVLQTIVDVCYWPHLVRTQLPQHTKNAWGNELNEGREECKKCGSHKLIIGVKE